MRDDRQLGHNFSSSNISAVADALRGGTDSNCGTPNFYSKYLLPALQVRHVAASIQRFRSLNSAPRVETTLGTKVRMHSGRDGLVSLFRHTQGGLVNASRIDLAFARVAQLILRLGLLVSTVQSFIRPFPANDFVVFTIIGTILAAPMLITKKSGRGQIFEVYVCGLIGQRFDRTGSRFAFRRAQEGDDPRRASDGRTGT